MLEAEGAYSASRWTRRETAAPGEARAAGAEEARREGLPSFYCFYPLEIFEELFRSLPVNQRLRRDRRFQSCLDKGEKCKGNCVAWQMRERLLTGFEKD